MNVELADIEIPDYHSGSYNFIRRLRGENECLLTASTDLNPEMNLESNIGVYADTKTPRTWPKLNIAIIGAGVGGLANAIALKRTGHNVQIYEQANALSEVGAGIQIPPNSTRILHLWGLKAALERRSVVPTALLWKRWEDGNVIGRANLNPESERRFGSPYYVTHRAHLHEVLHERVEELGVPVHLQKRVVNYDSSEGLVNLEDGNIIKADLVIAADGIKSSARPIINGAKHGEPIGHGLAAYRATIDMKDIRADPLTGPLAESSNLHLWVGHDRHVMSYAIAGGERFNLVLTHPADQEDVDLPMSQVLDKMRQHYAGWDPTLRRLLYMVSSTIEWPIKHIKVPEVWGKGRVVITGDAAHAMVPYMALGAAMAVEDAAALAETLTYVEEIGRDLPIAVSKWVDARMPRVKLVHAASYAHGLILHLPDGPVQLARDEAMKPEVEGTTVTESPNQWSDPTLTEWAYRHDPVTEVKRLWSKQPQGQT